MKFLSSKQKVQKSFAIRNRPTRWYALQRMHACIRFLLIVCKYFFDLLGFDAYDMKILVDTIIGKEIRVSLKHTRGKV